METNYLTTLSQELTDNQKQQIQNNIKLRVTDTSTDVAADDTTNHVTLDGITVYCKHINGQPAYINEGSTVYGKVYISSSISINAILTWNRMFTSNELHQLKPESGIKIQPLNYIDTDIGITINGYDSQSNIFDGIASIDIFTGTDMYHIWIKLVCPRQVSDTMSGTYTITITKD